MVQTGDTIKRHEAFMKGKGDDSLKHHVNAIMDDDFLQVVKHEKLQEGDFQVESSMSFGGSHWCRSTPSHEHRLKGDGCTLTDISFFTSIDKGSCIMHDRENSDSRGVRG